jgi:ankyrin repeat protein
MRYLIIILSLLFFACSKNSDKSELNSMDYELFNGTRAEVLAEAVKKGDTILIKDEILSKHIPVDIKNAEYGTTLLMMATYHNNIESAKCLLELGANPNLYNDTTKLWGENSVIIASRRMTPSTEMLQLLLSSGGDPNSQTKGVKYSNDKKIIPMRDFALQVASSYSIEKVKILLKAGADINKIGDDSNSSAIISAIVHNQMDILLYLLQNGADYTMKYPKVDKAGDTIENEQDILNELRNLNYPLNTEKHHKKMKVVKFLKTKGLDYSKSPVPNWVVKWAQKEYPNNWKEYIYTY